MSFDESDYGREEYEVEIARKAIEEDGLAHVLENQFDDVVDAVRQWQAREWLENSRDWLQLINVIAHHDREQVRTAIRRRVYGGKTDEAPGSGLQLFNLASEISKLLESLGQFIATDAPQQGSGWAESLGYGYRPGKAVAPLALYAQRCTVGEDLSWVSDLVVLTRAFRDILFAIGDPQTRSSLHWELSDRIKVMDAALDKGTRPGLVYRGIEQKRHIFGREPNPEATPLSTLLAVWMCDYLVDYSGRVDLGGCVECGKIFSRQRSDNAYCSKTCQNRVAYKRRKLFEGGLLRRIDITPKTGANLQPGAWAYHPRLGLGLVETVTMKYRSLSSVSVLFPQIARTFDGRDILQSGSDAPKVEFYAETDPAALAELM